MESKFLFRSYAAIGDSLTEGLGDFDFELSRSGGWADRLAELLALKAQANGQSFKFANLALRGSGALQILTAQLEDALRLKPDLVTIMAGANDLSASSRERLEIEKLLRGAIGRLIDAGCYVVVANTINPRHLNLFRPYISKSRQMSTVIDKVAAEFEIPVLNVFGINKFRELEYWAEDMVHFSGHGHIEVANRAADLLGLEQPLRFKTTEPLTKPARGFWGTLRWIAKHVVPFLVRRIRGRSSGDGMSPKHDEFVTLVSAQIRIDALQAA